MSFQICAQRQIALLCRVCKPLRCISDSSFPITPSISQTFTWRHFSTSRYSGISNHTPQGEDGFEDVFNEHARPHTTSPGNHANDQITVRKLYPRRDRSRSRQRSELMISSQDGLHRALIAFGSNLGNRLHYIEEALDRMKAKGLKVLKLSSLYETKAMYFEDQGSFLNGVVLVETDLPALVLLDTLQSIENELERTREISKGPRTIDLDIVLYDQDVIEHERLRVPHPLLLERTFVVKPMADVLPFEVLPLKFLENQQIFRKDVYRVCDALKTLKKTISTPIYCRTHLSFHLPLLQPTHTSGKTVHIMSILNITPDSFSDGGRFSPHDMEVVTKVVKSQIADGATILDIGGQSTRPNATLLSPEEELSRILPVLRHIKRNIPEAEHVAISIDTFYSSVVHACAEEDLFDIVNDVSAGTLDPKMFATVAELRKTIVLMHMRGTPQTMNQHTDYPTGLLKEVSKELSQRIVAAQEAGIPPWRIVLDPGLGFAKTLPQNLKLLRTNLAKWHPDRPAGSLNKFAWLIGASRKGFIGKVTDVEQADQRTWGTAACVTVAVLEGTDIVRVHDVKEMSQVVKMAAAIRDVPEEDTTETA